MNKFQILTRQIALYLLKATYFTLLLFKKLFDKKTILLVSKEQIKSYSVTPAFQVGILVLTFILGGIFAKSLQYNTEIAQKSVEISDLKKANEKFEDQVDALNANLKDINDYFKSVSGYNPQERTADKIEQKIKDLFGDLNLNDGDKTVAGKIADSTMLIDEIKGSAVKRINDLEEKLSIAGVTLVDNKAILISKNSKKVSDENGDVISLNDQKDLEASRGGPFRRLGSGFAASATSQIFNLNRDQISVKEELKYLINLEKFINFAPLATPIKNYYVSSPFGGRPDPFTRSSARHEGIDMAGIAGSKIFSPSQGKVIFAGKFGGYGNAVIIDHGYGFTTRYGHLSKIHVNEGDVVSKSQIIATQGSTGRSTGPHLHYEIRYKNLPLNPKKFLLAGQEIFNHKQDMEVKETANLANTDF